MSEQVTSNPCTHFRNGLSDAIAGCPQCMRAEIERLTDERTRWRVRHDDLSVEIERLRAALMRIDGVLPVLRREQIHAVVCEALGAAHETAGSLLRKPAAHAPDGCYCQTRCMAPVVQGQQTPCRDPAKRAAFKTSSETPAVKRGCRDCPHDVGDSYQRDCAYPDCVADKTTGANE